VSGAHRDERILENRSRGVDLNFVYGIAGRQGPGAAILRSVSRTEPESADFANDLPRRWREHDDVDALDQLPRGEVELPAQRLRTRGRGRFRPSVSASDLA
jgi:hypothetical protein